LCHQASLEKESGRVKQLTVQVEDTKHKNGDLEKQVRGRGREEV